MEGLIQIRPLGLEDLSAVLAIQTASPEAAQWSRESYVWFLERREEAFERLAWVVEQAGEAAGFLLASLHGEEMEILNLAVATDARRQGAGSLLIRQAVHEARERGVVQVYLEVRESNAGALAFYRRAGFEVSHRRENYYRNPTEDALILTRRLEAAG